MMAQPQVLSLTVAHFAAVASSTAEPARSSAVAATVTLGSVSTAAGGV